MKRFLRKKTVAVMVALLLILQMMPVKPALATFDNKAYYIEIGNKLENMANRYNIPPVLLKAIAWMESGWKQYRLDPATGQPLTDEPLIGRDGIGIGIMQISSYDPKDTEEIERLKTDIDYNIEIGCQMLNQKWRAFPKIGNGDRNVLENWYFAVWGYNSWAQRNNPNVLTGSSAYQDSVFSLMGQRYNSAVTFAPGATVMPKATLPPVNPPYYSGRWSTQTPVHLGDLAVDADSLMSSGGGEGTKSANGDYWFNYARWSSYYALGFYVTAYNSPTVSGRDKTILSEKILGAYKNLLAEADDLAKRGDDASNASAAKYYWTVLQGPRLNDDMANRANNGLHSALNSLITEADKQRLEKSGSSWLTAVENYSVVLQGSDTLSKEQKERARAGLLNAYQKLLTEADKLREEGSETSKATAAKYYVAVRDGLVLDSGLTQRAKIGCDLTGNLHNDLDSDYSPSRGDDSTTNTPPEPAPAPAPAPAPTPVPTPPTPSTKPFQLDRLYGTRAEDTAIKISQEGWGDNSSGAVLLARVDRFQDALAAAPLAKKLKAPLLLTSPYRMDQEVLKELKRLGAEYVYVIGGEGAITKSVTNALVKEGISYERIFGGEAADTAAAIARRIGPSTQVILASATSFPDALSASAPAADLGIPILLTEQKKLPDATKEILKEFKVTKTMIAGGKFVVSEAFDAKGGELEHYGPVRLAGETKYDTMLKIVKNFKQNSDTIIFATGETFPDGLSGGAFAALTGSPMVLIPKAELNSDTKDFLKSLNGTVKQAYILGGSGVISDSNEKTLRSLLTPQ